MKPKERVKSGLNSKVMYMYVLIAQGGVFGVML